LISCAYRNQLENEKIEEQEEQGCPEPSLQTINDNKD